MREWLGRNFLRRENSALWTFWVVCCTLWYASYGWWALIPLLIGAFVAGYLEEKWERHEASKDPLN